MPTLTVKDAVFISLLNANKDCLSLDELARNTGINLGTLLGCLTMLEHRGLIGSALADGIYPPRRILTLFAGGKKQHDHYPPSVAGNDGRRS